MKYALLLLPLSLFLMFFTTAETSNYTNIYRDDNGKIEYNLKSGRFHGEYTSYFTNGKKRAEGVFNYNNRVGIWSVWDSNGTLINKREYTDFLSFNRLFPKPSKDPTVIHLNKPKYKLERNQEGFYPYSNLQQRAVLWSKRIWRYLEKENNPKLFSENRLLTIFQKSIENKSFRTYSAKDDEFTEEITLTSEQLQNFNKNYSLFAFKIKEESFFDLDKMVMETRIIGIAPVGIHKTKKDTTEFYWLYYPELRPVLAREQLEYDKNTTPYIENLDDLFLFRDISGRIIKESNIYDRQIKEYANGIEAEKEAERIELSIIRSEHDLWLSLSE